MSDLVCISQQRWQSSSPRPQQIVSHLSRQNRVLFVEEPLCSLSAVKPYLEVFREDHHGAPNVTVVRLVLPVGKKRSISHDDPQAQRVYLRLLSKFMLAESYHNPIVWLDTPAAMPMASAIDHQLLIYDIPGFQHHADNAYQTAANSAV